MRREGHIVAIPCKFLPWFKPRPSGMMGAGRAHMREIRGRRGGGRTRFIPSHRAAAIALAVAASATPLTLRAADSWSISLGIRETGHNNTAALGSNGGTA